MSKAPWAQNQQGPRVRESQAVQLVDRSIRSLHGSGAVIRSANNRLRFDQGTKFIKSVSVKNYIVKLIKVVEVIYVRAS